MSRRSTSIPPPLNDILQHILPSTDLFSNEIVLIVVCLIFHSPLQDLQFILFLIADSNTAVKQAAFKIEKAKTWLQSTNYHDFWKNHLMTIKLW